jgi:hypothetical protein
MTNIIASSADFINYNIGYILLVSLILLIFRFYFSAKNISIEKRKTKINKVIVVEKMNNMKEKFDKAVKEKLSSSESCKKHNNKEICTALGSCVWAKTNDEGNIIGKCLEAETVDNSKTFGSDGPVDICYCSSKGKLIPWEKYYYSKGEQIIENKGKFCSAKGDKCIQ